MISVDKRPQEELLFACDECPICYGWESRLQNAIEGNYSPQFEYCGCEKTGDHEFYQDGYCGDAWVQQPTPKMKGVRHTGKEYRRTQERFHTIRRLGIAHSCGYTYGVWDNNGRVGRRRKSVREGFLKRVSNRRVRHSSLEPSGSRSAYRRIFDYWWELD